MNQQYARHKLAVAKLAEELNGVTFTKAPFDIIDRNRHFYEVKCVGELKKRHSNECHVSISENELAFGDLFGNEMTYVIIFKANRYFIPFDDLKKIIKRYTPIQSNLWGIPRVIRVITLGKTFLAKYLASW